MDETKKRGRGRPPLSEEQKKANALARKNGELAAGKPQYVQEHVQPGDNSKYIRHALATLDLPPIDIADPTQVEDRIQWYFHHCIEGDMKPTVMGCAMLSAYLGIQSAPGIMRTFVQPPMPQ